MIHKQYTVYCVDPKKKTRCVSKEIAQALQAEQVARQTLGDKLSMMTKFQAPIIEAR